MTTTKDNLYTPYSIRTVTGKYFNYEFPTTAMVDIEDIAHALCRIPRFLGHTTHHIPVASHCMMMASTLKEDGSRYALEALLHDASEAYLCDIPKPLKDLLPDYNKMEDKVCRVIAQKFHLEYPWPKEVTKLDKEMLELEWHLNVLGGDRMLEWFGTEKTMKDQFLYFFERLKR